MEMKFHNGGFMLNLIGNCVIKCFFKTKDICDQEYNIIQLVIYSLICHT